MSAYTAIGPYAGYSCQRCSFWVFPGSVHNCVGYSYPAKPCDHCYCEDADPSLCMQPDHKRCCKCLDTRAAVFVGKDGR